MVHELLGIHNNRIDLSKVPGISKDLQVGENRQLENVRFTRAHFLGFRCENKIFFRQW